MPDDPLCAHHGGVPKLQDPIHASPAGAPFGALSAQSPRGMERPAPAAEDPYEGAVPPGYDWPTDGGYLGCLMGTLGGFMLGGFLDANLFSFLWASGHLSGPLFILIAFVVLIGCVWALGRLGLWLGKRFYRAYEQPVRPVWGEDDEEPAVGPVADDPVATPNGSSAAPDVHPF